jgi:signal transduction histidine kinase
MVGGLLIFTAIAAGTVASFIVRSIGRPWILAIVFGATLLIVASFAATVRRVALLFREQVRLRRQLMADVAHELRTPLSILQGRIEGLLDGVYPRDDARLSELLTETQHLGRLIEDLRTLANAEAGALDLRKERVDLIDVIREAISAIGAQVTLDGPEEWRIEIDPVRIREVLLNVLGNAVQHAPEGHVAIDVQPNTRDVVLRVCDDGPGIPADELPRLFERFHKGRNSKGSGLGLAIAKKLVEAHGGRISVTSTVGIGTTVTITLPL